MKAASSRIVIPFQKAVIQRKVYTALASFASQRTASKKFDRVRVIRQFFKKMFDGSKEQRVMIKL